MQDAAGGSCHRLTQFDQDVMNARKRSEFVDPAFDIDEPEKRLYADTISSQTLSRRSTTMIMTMRLQDPLMLADMLDYMADNPDSTPEQLYERCLTISSAEPSDR